MEESEGSTPARGGPGVSQLCGSRVRDSHNQVRSRPTLARIAHSLKEVRVIKRANASGGSVKVTFVVGVEECDQPVSVVGDFNGWDPLATPLRKRSNGTRSASVELRAGESYRFKYLAEGGRWFCDSDVELEPDVDRASANSLLTL